MMMMMMKIIVKIFEELASFVTVRASLSINVQTVVSSRTAAQMK